LSKRKSIESIKLFIITSLLVISHQASSQYPEIVTTGILSRISYHEKTDHQITREDGTQERITSSGIIKSKFTLGLGLQLGYFFNANWSAGAQGSIGISAESWDLIIPDKMGLYTSGGIYGKYHFNDIIGVMTAVNVNKNYNYSPKIAFGFGPEITTSDGVYGFRLFFEYGVGGRRDNANTTNGYDSQGFYTIDQANILNSSYTLQAAAVFYPFGK
jgi:hypothetical protein